jgi:hypothetical protein
MDIEDGLIGAMHPAMNNFQALIPPGLPTPEEIDALIAQEMTRMSLEEREKALDDVHGILVVKDEDPDFVSSCLDELEDHLTTIKHNTAYALAEAISRQYVYDEKLRMMFLRADEYEPQQAAERMIRFFELKKSLFGVQKLVKDIVLDDLDEDDMATLKTGCVQVSPYRDTAGRPIVLFFQRLRIYNVVENMVCTF